MKLKVVPLLSKFCKTLSNPRSSIEANKNLSRYISPFVTEHIVWWTFFNFLFEWLRELVRNNFLYHALAKERKSVWTRERKSHFLQQLPTRQENKGTWNQLQFPSDGWKKGFLLLLDLNMVEIKFHPSYAEGNLFLGGGTDE